MNALSPPGLLDTSALSSPADDAAIVALAGQHASNVRAINQAVDPIEDDDPKWTAYFATQALMADAGPRTMAGVVAMAKAIRAEAELADGKFDDECRAGETAAWEFVLRLAGSAAA